MEQNVILMHNLSSAIQTSLTALQTSEFLNTTNHLLSAVQQLSGISQITELNNLINDLSSIPLHPYQNLIWQHFEPGYNFKTIEDVPEPDDVPMNECLKYISSKEQEISQTAFHNLTCKPEQRLTSHFEFLSGEQIICNIEKQKNYLEFFEMLRQIPLDSITPENSNSLIKKIVAEYIKVI